MVDRIFESVLFINEDNVKFDTFFNADKTGFKLVHSTDGRIPCYFNTFEKEYNNENLARDY